MHLSFSSLTFIKSARSISVCLCYISTAVFYQSDNQNININKPMWTGQIFFWLIFDWTFLVAFSASRSFFGRFSEDKNWAANPAISYGWGSGQCLFLPWRSRLLNWPVYAIAKYKGLTLRQDTAMTESVSAEHTYALCVHLIVFINQGVYCICVWRASASVPIGIDCCTLTHSRCLYVLWIVLWTVLCFLSTNLP